MTDEVFRAPMRARDRDDVPPGAGAEHGLAHGLVGIGPGTGAKAERMAERFETLPAGAFLWTRLTDGTLRVGRVAGPARAADAATRTAVGLTLVRDADWLDRPLHDDEAPVAVVATFARGGLNLQRINDPSVLARTEELWEAHAP